MRIMNKYWSFSLYDRSITDLISFAAVWGTLTDEELQLALRAVSAYDDYDLEAYPFISITRIRYAINFYLSYPGNSRVEDVTLQKIMVKCTEYIRTVIYPSGVQT